MLTVVWISSTIISFIPIFTGKYREVTLLELPVELPVVTISNLLQPFESIASMKPFCWDSQREAKQICRMKDVFNSLYFCKISKRKIVAG